MKSETVKTIGFWTSVAILPGGILLALVYLYKKKGENKEGVSEETPKEQL